MGMVQRIFVLMVTCGAAGLFASPVWAQELDPQNELVPQSEPRGELEYVTRLPTYVLEQGQVQITVPIALNLSDGEVGKPTSIPLDVYYGVTENLTVGITHSNGVVQPVSPYLPGTGVCLTGEDNGCSNVYDNVGIDSIYRIIGDSIMLAWHGGLGLSSFDPAQLFARVGVLLDAPLSSRLSIIADPRLLIGLTERDSGNEEFFSIPVGVQYWATPDFRVAVRTVFSGPVQDFSDAYTGSAGAYAGYAVTDAQSIFAAFDFLNLYGDGGNADARALTVGVNLLL